MLTDEQRVKMQILEEYGHKEMMSISMFLSRRQRMLPGGRMETVGECIDRVYAEIEERESRK